MTIPLPAPWLPAGFLEWLPGTQALTLALLTFVQEDVPTFGAALLAAAGVLGLQTGFWGCFLGIWLGDALLYAVARGLGRPALTGPRLSRWLNPEAVGRSEDWFARKGAWLLVSSRFIPGTRLPTYLAAGFLRLHPGKFLLITGSVALLWTAGIFFLANRYGAGALRKLGGWGAGAWAVPLLVLLGWTGLRSGLELVKPESRRRIATWFGRWLRWEFWPAWLFYGPVALKYLALALRHRGLTLPTLANPGIFSGGLVGESKIDLLQILQRTSPEFTADAYSLLGTDGAARAQYLRELCATHRISLPFVLKPDVGQRGAGVKLMRTWAQAEDYARDTSSPLIVQRYAPGPGEVGIFYYRRPGEERGRIFAITEKIFPTVMGDGIRTLEELIWADERARFAADKYLRRLGARRAEIPAVGKAVKLVEAGNHAQGCIFLDGARLWTDELERRIDEISRKVEGFYIGRYDIRFPTEEDLRAGRNLQIVELNGAAAEATSIYDARNSLLSAYRTLFRQWELVFEIGARNRADGNTPMSVRQLWRAWRETNAKLGMCPAAD